LLLSASVLWTFNQEKVLLNVVHNLGVVLVTLAAALHYRHAPWRLPVEFGYVLGANMALQVAAVLLLPSYAIDWQARWQGLTVHPNTLGALAFTTFWANAAALAGTVRPARPRLHLIGCALAVAAMLGADSVTSKLASLAALLLLLLFATLRRRGAGRRFYFGLLALGAICALLFLALRNTIDLSWLFDLLGRDSQLTGRSNVWDDAFKAIGMRPLLGWGFDDHAYLIATEGMPYSSYHSGVLDLAVNGGITAVVLLALLVWRWAACLLQAGRIGPHTAAFSAAFVLSYMLHNVTEASYLSPRGQMWVIFLTLLFLGACRRPQSAMAAQAVPAMQHAPA
jgi:O-antigen ligase